jgi:8-amino-7-oxononanoate synthase
MPPEFSLLGQLEDQLASLSDQQLRRQLREVQTPTAPSLVVDGESLTAFCSNDYLGLASDPRVIEALREGALRYGAGSGASHLISGHSTAHAALEARLADMQAAHLIKPRALFFSTGYMANLAVLTALAGKDADIFSEALNHASLIDGARLSRARVTIYTRDDLSALDRQLASSTATTKLVVTDSVFSMEGASRLCLNCWPCVNVIRPGWWWMMRMVLVCWASRAQASCSILDCARRSWCTSAHWARRPVSRVLSWPPMPP